MALPTITACGGDPNGLGERSSTRSTTRTSTLIDRRTSTDERFFEVLAQQSVPINSEDDALILAQAVCLSLRTEPVGSADDLIRTNEPDFTPYQIQWFMGASIGGYCPDQQDKIGG